MASANSLNKVVFMKIFTRLLLILSATVPLSVLASPTVALPNQTGILKTHKTAANIPQEENKLPDWIASMLTPKEGQPSYLFGTIDEEEGSNTYYEVRLINNMTAPDHPPAYELLIAKFNEQKRPDGRPIDTQRIQLSVPGQAKIQPLDGESFQLIVEKDERHPKKEIKGYYIFYKNAATQVTLYSSSSSFLKEKGPITMEQDY